MSESKVEISLEYFDSLRDHAKRFRAMKEALDKVEIHFTPTYKDPQAHRRYLGGTPYIPDAFKDKLEGLVVELKQI